MNATWRLVAAGIIFLLAVLFGYLLSARGQGEIDVPISKYERQLLDIDKKAIEEAYHDQIKHLFEGWMKDGTGQPTRAVTGARQARKAYEASMDAIARREKRLRGED